MAPKVNILIANYNYAEWLESSIMSAVKQDYDNIMITVVDSASTDNSWEIIENLCERKSVYRNENTTKIVGVCQGRPFIGIRLSVANGPSYARNIGIDETIDDCDIFAILDADDEYYPSKVSRCVAELAQTPMIGVTYTDYYTLNTETNELAIEYKEPFSRGRLLQSCIVHSNAIIAKRALIEVKDEFGYYDINMRTCEDYDLWIRISEKFFITHIAEPLSLVRIQPRNSTRTVDGSIWQQNWARISAKLNQRMGK